MVAPQGIVWLGHVPWDDSYRHVYYEGMRNKGGMITDFMSLQTTSYTYIREDTNIRVPYNADTLYGINYCMYQNDGMWFCAFVNTITYVNNNTSLLHLKEDVWHTWGGSATVKSCMVAREHVNSDSLGEWRASEPALSLEGWVMEVHEFTQNVFNTLIIATNAIPHLKAGVSGTIFTSHSETDFDGSDAVSGGRYGSLFSGSKYYGFSWENAGAAVNFLDNLNMCGAAESVSAMFMMPSTMVTINNNYEVSPSGSHIDSFFLAPQTHGGGYAPRNKKCLTYPYAYASIVDFNGSEMQVKYEDCDTWGSVQYRLEEGLDPTANVYLTLRNHMGKALDLQHMITLNQNPQCSWVYSAYMNWAAQNATNIQVKQGWNAAGSVGGLIMIVAGAMLFASGAGAAAGAPMAASGLGGALGLTTTQAVGMGIAASGAGSSLSSIRSQSELTASIESQQKVPNHISGSTSGNSLQSIGRNEGGYVCYGLQRQSAERLDMFFDVLGYQVDMVKVPNLTGRPSWNYVKTVGANVQGNIPADKLAVLNATLDNGMTFWHTTDVGNYALNNQLT